MDEKHYMPILKSKAGEFNALSQLDSELKKNFTPLIELTPIPLKWIDGQEEPEPGKSIDAHIKWLVDGLCHGWQPKEPFFLDGFHLEEEDSVEDGREPITAALDSLVAAEMRPIPVVGIDRVLEYMNAVRDFVARQQEDICLRITSYDLEGTADTRQQINSALTHLAVDPSRVHLVMDYGALPPAVLGPLKGAVPQQLSTLADIGSWKSFTMAGSGFPVNLAEVSKYSLDEFKRTEWLLWTHVRSSPNTKRLPTFGDYTVVHPELFEFDPRLMRMSPKIKYTDDVRWMVAKGEAFRRKKDPRKSVPARDQYPVLAKMIVEHSSWKGADFSWGDGQIAATAEGAGRSDAQTWVSVGVVHHIVFCVRQLANLHAP